MGQDSGDEVIGGDYRGGLQRRKAMTHGWTKARRAQFLDALANSCNVQLALREVGLRHTAAYALRRNDAQFAAQWQMALEVGYHRLETALLRRALEAVDGLELDERDEPVVKMTVAEAMHVMGNHRKAVLLGGVRRRLNAARWSMRGCSRHWRTSCAGCRSAAAMRGRGGRPIAPIAATMPVTHGGTSDLWLRASGSALLDRAVVLESTGRFRPGADNSQTLGWTTHRWQAVYAVTGTIQTSDARDKIWRGGPSDDERRAARRIIGELGFFQWTDAVAAKGSAGARWHFGVRAQAVWDIMADEGLVEARGADGAPGQTPYGFLCFDRWDDGEGGADGGGDRFGVRPDQLALFLIAVLADAVLAPC